MMHLIIFNVMYNSARIRRFLVHIAFYGAVIEFVYVAQDRHLYRAFGRFS